MEQKRKGLSAPQLTMMALGTVIGGSFFLGSSVAINAAGPSVILSYLLGGIMVYFILFALSEMTVADPESGSFQAFASHAFGNGMGFLVGWVYWTGMVLAMSSEATAVSILIKDWIPDISVPFLGSGIIILITLVNLMGASKLSKIESALAAVKLFAIIFFILLSVILIIGFFPGISAIGSETITRESFMPGGIKSVAGSMLIVIFSYAGFEVIGLAASETDTPEKTVPRAIHYTVLSLVSLYLLSIIALLFLIPTDQIGENTSPMVAALNRYGIRWVGSALNIVLITAILSTMLAAMFGIGRMMRSLADEGLAPGILKDKSDVPYRGILFSGLGMLSGLFVGLLFPGVYLFLISSGGFAVLFTYLIIVLTHIKFRKKHGKPDSRCRLCWFPFSSLFVALALVISIASMPFIAGQLSGFIAGIVMVVYYLCCYFILKVHRSPRHGIHHKHSVPASLSKSLTTEFSKELSDTDQTKD